MHNNLVRKYFSGLFMPDDPTSPDVTVNIDPMNIVYTC